MSIGLAIGTHLGRAGGASKAIAYLLRDLFTTARAAGTVGGTNAEPGPGTRVVTGTAAQVSIAGGGLAFAGASAATVELSTNVNRTLRSGMVLLMPGYTPATTAPNVEFGWDLTPGGGVAISVGFRSTGSLKIIGVENGAGTDGYNLAQLTQGQTYDFALIKRLLGNSYFWRTAGGTWWLLQQRVAASPVPNSDSRVLYSSTSGAVSFGAGVAVYQGTFLPTPLVSDGFDHLGGLTLTDGNGHIEAQQGDTPGLGGDGLPWTVQSGTFGTTTGKLTVATLGGGIALATVDAGTLAVNVEAVPTRSAGVVGLVLRYVDANNHIRVYHDGTNHKIDKVVAGVVTNVYGRAQAYSATARLIAVAGHLGVTSNFQTSYSDNTAGGLGDFSYVSITDAALQTGTLVGVYATDTSATWDNLAAWPYAYGAGSAPAQTVAARAVTVFAPAPWQVLQRTGTTGGIPISGTYAGGGTVSIEARFNGGAWATIATGVTGAFSGTLAAQAQGTGSLDVRPVGGTVGASVHHVGIGDVYVIAGQSNASGRATNLQVWSGTAPLHVGLYGNDGVWHRLTDPTDSVTGQLDSVSDDSVQSGTGGYNRGSYWPPLATQLLTNRAVPVAFVPTALGGSQIASWQPGANHQDRTTLYGSLVYRAKQQPNGIKAVLWHQGESEAAVSFGLSSNAYYAGQLASLGDAVYADLGCPLVAARIHLWTTGGITTDATHQGYVNGGINATIGTHHVVAGPDFSSPNWTSDVHGATDAEMSDAATRWYNALVAAGL